MRALKLFFIAILIGTFSLPVFSDAGNISVREAFIQSLKSFLGTPYKYGGLSTSGIDCSGLLYQAALQSLQMQLPRTVSAMQNQFDVISLETVLPGDVIFFNTLGSGASHAGVYIGDGLFIHAASEGDDTGVIITPLNKTYWQKHLVSAGRFIHDENGIMYADFIQKQKSEKERDEFANGVSTWFGKYFDIELIAAPCFELAREDNQFAASISGGSGIMRLRFDIANFYCGIASGVAITSSYNAVPLRCFAGYGYVGVYYGLLPGMFYEQNETTDIMTKVELGIMCNTPELQLFKQYISLAGSWGIMRDLHDSFQFRDFYQDAFISAGIKVRLSY